MGPAHALDAGRLFGAAQSATKAALLTDDEVRAYASQMIKHADAQATIAPPTHPLAKRLEALSVTEDKGLPINTKLYLTNEVNAFAMADGSIRFYSGLMNLMTDDELRYVLGHEIGHIHAGHSRKRMQLALSASAARDATASSKNKKVAVLADSEVGGVIVQVVQAQHSQSNENEADDLAMEFMSRRNFDRKACVTALEKLDKLSAGGGGGWLATHPAPKERAARMQAKLA